MAENPQKKMRLLSKDLLQIFSFCDQEECIKLQLLNKQCYNRYIPQTLHTYIFERPYVHLYLSNRKRFIVCFLDNMKAYEMPAPRGENPQTTERTESNMLASSERLTLNNEPEPIEQTPRIGFKIPDRLQNYVSAQFYNTIIVVGGQQSYLEMHCIPPVQGQFSKTTGMTWLFDVKKQRFRNLPNTELQQPRCMHAMVVTQCPQPLAGQTTNPNLESESYYGFVAGGRYEKTSTDLFKKKTTQVWHDTGLVEVFDFKTETWNTFCARLSMARHQAAICELNGYLYVLGGHTVNLPNEYINSIERCHITSLQSQFEVVDISYKQLDIRLQTCLCFPAQEDNGILLVGMAEDGSNQGFFVDVRNKSVQSSKFNLAVGPINHWASSKTFYKNMTVYLTEQMEVLRFDHQSSDWSLLDISKVEWVCSPDTVHEAGYGDDEIQITVPETPTRF